MYSLSLAYTQYSLNKWTLFQYAIFVCMFHPLQTIVVRLYAPNVYVAVSI